MFLEKCSYELDKKQSLNFFVKTFKLKHFNFPHSFHENLLENYKAIWTKIDDLKKIEVNGLPAYDERYINNKTRTYNDNIDTNFRGLNVPEDDKEWESFTANFY